MSSKNKTQPADGFQEDQNAGTQISDLDWSGGNAEVAVRYQPMWDTKLNAVSTYLAVPSLERSGEQILGRRQIGFALPNLRQQSLDEQVFAVATESFGQLLAEGQRALMCLPIHFDGLSSAATRHAVTEKFAALDEAVRTHIVVEVIGLPDGIPATRLIDITLGLKQHARAVIVQGSVKDRNFSTYRDAGINICGLEMTGRPADETKTIKLLTEFVEMARKAGLQTYLHGSPSNSVTIAALAAGFTYISGESIASLSDLKAVERFNLRDFYRQSDKSA